jgi:hypothetical protein
MSRTRRQAYTKSKRFDKTCRNHGSCSWCYGNRMHNVIKKIYPIKEEIIEFEYRDEDIDSPIEQLLYGTEERK